MGFWEGNLIAFGYSVSRQGQMVLPSARGFIATKAQRHKGLFLRNNMVCTSWNFLSAAVGLVLEWFKGSRVQRFKVRLRKVFGRYI